MTAPADNIWAYLHNELSPAEIERFEQALTEDPALREALDECRMTHEGLTALGQKTLSNEQLEEQLLADWVAEHPEYAEEPSQPTRRKILRLSLPLTAAAAVVILLALPSKPIRWQNTAYGKAPQLRGESAMSPHYTREDLKKAASELQNTINSTDNDPKKWTLQILLQELINGALTVEVSGQSQGASMTWAEHFQSLEEFRQKIPMFGKKIADDL